MGKIPTYSPRRERSIEEAAGDTTLEK